MGQSTSSAVDSVSPSHADDDAPRRMPAARSSSSRSGLSRRSRLLRSFSAPSVHPDSASGEASAASIMARPGNDTPRHRFPAFSKRLRHHRSRSSSMIHGEALERLPTPAEPAENDAVRDKREEAHRDRPALRHSVSEVRLSGTESTLEPPIAILPLPLAEEIVEVTEAAGPESTVDLPLPASGNLNGPSPASTEPPTAHTAPARRIVVTGTVSTLPRSAPPTAPASARLVPSQVSLNSAADDSPSPTASSSSAVNTASSDDPQVSRDATTNPSMAEPSDQELSTPFAVPVTSSDGHAEQAVLISRLLSVAAAATAASLLPGHIRLNGQLIEGFPTAMGTVGTSTTPLGVPVSNNTSSLRPPSGNNRVASWRERLRARPRSPSASPVQAMLPLPDSAAAAPTSPISGQFSPLSPLQAILRQALAAEFGAHAPEVRRADEIDNSTRSSTPSPTEGEDNATDTSREGAIEAAATTFLLSSPPPDRAGDPASTAPEGSFEHFLNHLQVDVSLAILRALREQVDPPSEPCDDEFLLLSRSATAVTSRESRRSRSSPTDSRGSMSSHPPFSFFRSYRWPDHQLDSAGMLSEGVSGSNASASGGRIGDTRPAANASLSGAPSEDSPVSVAPVLLVGVRTVDMPMARPSSPSTATSEPMSQALGDAASIGGSSGESGATDAGQSAESQRSWMIWIAGGVYPTNHPLLAFPALLSGFDNAATYEDLLRLAEIMGGQHKPPVATQADIDASGLRVIKGCELPDLVAEGSVHVNTSDRCLICLEDWQSADDARILGCRHAFHKACVDRWISTTNNNCPCCRSRGVAPGSGSSSSPVEPTNQMLSTPE